VPTVAAEALAAVRKAKSEARQSMRADVASATVTAPGAQVALVEAVRIDLTNAGRIQSLTVVPGDGPLTVDVVLAETPAEG
jgi:valyl-tRNA synthetase